MSARTATLPTEFRSTPITPSKGTGDWLYRVVTNRSEPFRLTAEQFDRPNMNHNLSWPTDWQNFLFEQRRNTNTPLNKLDLLSLIAADRDDEVSHLFALRILLVLADKTFRNHTRNEIRVVFASRNSSPAVPASARLPTRTGLKDHQGHAQAYRES